MTAAKKKQTTTTAPVCQKKYEKVGMILEL
jgi:hypothetical protein